MRLYSYSQYTGNSRRKRVTRVLALLALAAAIFAAFLILGNLLTDRMEQAAPLLALPSAHAAYTKDTAAAENVYLYTQASGTDSAPGGAFCALDPAEYATADDVRAACALAAELYDGISLTPDVSALPAEETVRALASAADTYSLTFAAALSLEDGTDAAADAAETLAALGVSEIVFTGAGTPTADEVYALCTLYAHLKQNAPSLAVGFSLSPAMFREANRAPVLETFAGYVDFLALDTSECGADEKAAAELCDALRGSIRYYSLRVLIGGEASARAAQTETLREAGVASLWQLGG